MSSRSLGLSLVLLLAFCLSAVQAVGLLSIDYGTDSFKVSFIGPGSPFDVLMNRDSKRKTASVVTLHGSDRHVGGDAATLATRYPLESFSGAKLLLGSNLDQAQKELHQKLYSNKMELDSEGRLKLARPDGKDYTPQEIIGMQFAYARDMAEVASKGDKTFDTVITVPAFFDQWERQSLMDAAELAGLRVISLVNDGTAAAVNFAMTRTFSNDTPEHHLFYDAGSSSIRATVVSFQGLQVKDHPASKTSKNATQLDVKSFGFAKAVGGLTFDARIRDILADQFEAKNAGLEVPLRENHRAMAKLLKEAGRVKQVLSANQEAPSRVEGLAEDIDFKGSISREQFESACADLVPQFAQPITDALREAGLSADDLTSVVLVGGASRVPMVQAGVRSLISEEKIAQNLNADEAGVMGAALYGAALSKQFRTKDIRVSDVSPKEIHMMYQDDSENSAPVYQLIFPKNTKLGSTKTLNIPKRADFPLQFSYEGETGAEKTTEPLFSTTITGFEKALNNLTAEEVSNSTVKVTVELTSSNILTVSRAVLALPERTRDSTVTERIKNLFSGSKDKKDEKKEGEDAEDDSEDETEDKPLVLPAESKRLGVEMTYNLGYAAPLSAKEKTELKKKLREMDQAEIRKVKREEARNGLEAYLYKLRDQIQGAAFVESSTDNERTKLKEKLESATEWLSDMAESATMKDFKTRQSELERTAASAISRITEALQRPGLVESLQAVLGRAEQFYEGAKTNLTQELLESNITRHTAEELEALSNQTSSTLKWFLEAQGKQSSLAKNVDPFLKKLDLEKKSREIQDTLDKLSKKRRRRVQPTSSSTATSSEPTESSAISSEPEATTTALKDEL